MVMQTSSQTGNAKLHYSQKARSAFLKKSAQKTFAPGGVGAGGEGICVW
jgi:hypothetical protein